jgi:acetyl-CoA carboxylase biotin carboxyl carrier protein
MNLEEIKELVQVVVESGVAELEVTRGDNKVRIQRSHNVTTQEIVVPPQAAQVAPQPVMPPAANPVAVAPAAPPVVEEPPTPVDENLKYVESPIVGTFYEAPSPDAEPFVKVGDRVSPGQVLCIIESMKLMNEIEAEFAGTVAGKLVENGRPVEYGEALFSIRPE